MDAPFGGKWTAEEGACRAHLSRALRGTVGPHVAKSRMIVGRLKRGQEFCLSYQNIPGMLPGEQRELQPPQAGGRAGRGVLAPGTGGRRLGGGLGWGLPGTLSSGFKGVRAWGSPEGLGLDSLGERAG